MSVENVPTPEAPSMRLRVNKTYKMYVGGAFVRSESGRCFSVQSDKRLAGSDLDVVNIPQGSRKDLRDAIRAAQGAQEAWANRTAYNRGQVVYRLAEVLEARREELMASLQRGGARREDALREVDVAIDRTVYYAGFSDKVASLLSSSNPVAGPHFAFSVPEPMGVVGVVAPQAPSLLGLLSTVLPAVVGGNAVIVVASAVDPRTAIVCAECMATSDFPGPLVQVVTGFASELAPVLASHREVAALFVHSDEGALRTAVEAEGSQSVKRVYCAGEKSFRYWAEEAQGLGWIERCVETKSLWHPKGL